MSYVKVAANLTFDNPDAYGHVDTMGFGKNWTAAEPKVKGRRTPDFMGQYGWHYNNLEYIEPMKAIAPLGEADLVGSSLPDMSFDDWEVDRWPGPEIVWQNDDNENLDCKWILTPKAGQHRGGRWLHYVDGTPGLHGAGEYQSIISNAAWPTALIFWFWQMPPDEAETDPTYFVITFHGDGEVPLYALYFPRRVVGEGEHETVVPTDSRRQMLPTLYGRPQGEERWTVVDECRSGLSGLRAEDTGAVFQMVKIEFTDEWLLVGTIERDEPWAYRGGWTSRLGFLVDEFEMVPGKVEVNVIGQTAKFNVATLTYPQTAIMYPTTCITVPERIQKVPYYRRIATPQAYAADPETEPRVGVEVDWVDERHYKTRPKVTFERPSDKPTERAALYNVQEFRYSVLTPVNHNPVQTQGNPTRKLLSIGGELSDKWRSATLNARLQAKPGSALPAIPINSVARAEVSVDAGVTYHNHFSGRVAPPEIGKPPGARPSYADLSCGDDISVRFPKKKLYGYCSLEGWPVDEAFVYLLGRGASVRTELIDIDPLVCPEEMGEDYFLPIGEPKGKRMLDFAMDMDLISALDTITKIRDLQWGQKQDGRYFLRVPLEHVPGAFDFTIDKAAGGEDIILSLRDVRSLDDFVNVIVVMAGTGWDTTAKVICNWASIEDSADPAFSGDDWWHIETYHDSDNVHKMARRLEEQRMSLADVIYADLRDRPELMPDHEVEVQGFFGGSGVRVADGTIFHIAHKTWHCDPEEGQYRQTLEGHVVETP